MSSRKIFEYGLIPNLFVALPVVPSTSTSGRGFAEEDLTDQEPRVGTIPALVEMENIELDLCRRGALARSPAVRSMRRPGAPGGLRFDPRDILLETMFDLPALEGRREVVISRGSGRGNCPSLYIYATVPTAPSESIFQRLTGRRLLGLPSIPKGRLPAPGAALAQVFVRRLAPFETGSFPWDLTPPPVPDRPPNARGGENTREIRGANESKKQSAKWLAAPNLPGTLWRWQ